MIRWTGNSAGNLFFGMGEGEVLDVQWRQDDVLGPRGQDVKDENTVRKKHICSSELEKKTRTPTRKARLVDCIETLSS